MNAMDDTQNLMPEYDVIVIGAGIGGLTAANRLAHFGRSVLLVEQGPKPGGLAACFQRQGHIFDTALHGFPSSMKKTCRKYWSRDMADCIVPLGKVCYDNPQFKLDTPFTAEDFTAKLTSHFGVGPGAVEQFFRACRETNFFDKPGQTTREFLEQFFPGRNDVMRFVMEPMTYANGSTLDEPALTYGVVFSNFLDKGIYFFRGGTDKFMDMACAELERKGVRILTNTRVQQIVVENGRAVGIATGENTVRAKAVIANANLRRTIQELLPTAEKPERLARQAGNLQLSTSISQVYIGIREEEDLPEIGDIIFHSTAPEFSPKTYLAHPPVSRSLSIYYPRSRPGHNRFSIVASMGARYEDWAGLPPEEYRQTKQSLINDTLDVLEKYDPAIRAKADHLEAATPLTFERYTLHPGGATFGTKFPGARLSEDLPRTIPGLYHTGSVGIIMSGWLGAANYGVIVANRVIEYLEG